MRVADWLIQCLESAGIGHAFVVSGGGAAFLGDALRLAKQMKYVCCHHEQAAGFAAESYARLRGLGLCIVTSGPGGTNAVTACASAWQDHVPVLFISGQVFSSQTAGTRALPPRTLGVQEIDAIALVRSITKYAVQITDPTSIRFHVERAIYEARSGRPGPCWIDLPANIQAAEVDPDQLVGFSPEPKYNLRPRRLMHRAAEDVLALLQAARRPLLHIGQGVRLSPGALDALLALAEGAGIPILTARNGNDLIPSDHPLYIGRPGTFSQRGANFAVQSCDLYLAIGTRLSLAQTGYNARDYARGAKVVQVDVDRAELEKDTVPVHLKVQADAGEFLRALLEQAAELLKTAPFDGTPCPDWSAWLAHCKALQAKYPVVTAEHLREIGLVHAEAGR